MSDISVQYLSRVVMPVGMGVNLHTHDYWHFSLNLEGVWCLQKKEHPTFTPSCSCYPAKHPNQSVHCAERALTLNVMFHVAEGALKQRLERFPFKYLGAKNLHIPVLIGIFQQVYDLSPSQEFIDAAFTYYLHLLMESAPKTREFRLATISPVEKALEFIEQNYMNPIQLEDVANHIGRGKTYTSHLISSTTGKTFIEHLNSVRVQKACALLAYSSIPLEEVSRESGFTTVKNFGRVFKGQVGVRPNAYRTSHAERDMYYTDECVDLNTPYPEQVFTYVCAARKRFDWKTPLDYATQNHV